MSELRWRVDGPFVDVKGQMEMVKVGVRHFSLPGYTPYRNWLIANVAINAWWIESSMNHREAYRIRFKHDSDAVMFKLNFADNLA